MRKCHILLSEILDITIAILFDPYRLLKTLNDKNYPTITQICNLKYLSIC